MLLPDPREGGLSATLTATTREAPPPAHTMIGIGRFQYILEAAEVLFEIFVKRVKNLFLDAHASQHFLWQAIISEVAGHQLHIPDKLRVVLLGRSLCQMHLLTEILFHQLIERQQRSLELIVVERKHLVEVVDALPMLLPLCVRLRS